MRCVATVMALLIDTRVVPSSERFRFWADMHRHGPSPVEVLPADQLPFAGRMSERRLGPLKAEHLVGRASRAVRTQPMIAARDPDELFVCVYRSGRSKVKQDGRTADLRGGEVLFLDSSRPSDWEAFTAFDLFALLIPWRVLGLEREQVRNQTAAPVRSDAGPARVAVPFLLQLSDYVAEGTPRDDDANLGESALALVRGMLAPVADHQKRDGTDHWRARIRAYALANLHDRALSPAQIAGVHGISTRYVHRLFCDEGAGISEWIRGERLERCRRDLGDPTLVHTSISDIATRWGLANPQHFSRLFRAAYGCTPSEYRRAYPTP